MSRKLLAEAIINHNISTLSGQWAGEQGFHAGFREGGSVIKGSINFLKPGNQWPGYRL